jgi:hypothetical protein
VTFKMEMSVVMGGDVGDVDCRLGAGDNGVRCHWQWGRASETTVRDDDIINQERSAFRRVGDFGYVPHGMAAKYRVVAIP